MVEPVVETGVNPVPAPTLIVPDNTSGKKIGNNQFSKEAKAKRAIENDASLKKLMDPVWRLCNLYQVRTKVQGYEGQTVRFYPNTVQKRIYNAMAKYNRVIILKPRKLGVTTALCVYLLDKAMYSKNQSCRTIAHRKQTVAELFNDIVRYAFDRVSPVIRPEIRYSTRAELDFGRIGSKYSIDVEARGMTPTLLHLSETAYIDDEAKLQDTLESLPLTARGVCESTANGKGNWFERTFTTNWKLMQQGRNPEWYPMFFAWFDDPTNYLLYRPGDEFYFKSEVDQLRSTYKNMDGTPLSDRQLLWWDRKRLELGHRMPELYPSNPDEAFIFSTGRVYDEFNRVMHVIQPVSYTDYDIAMDFGLQNPMVFLCIHQDGDGNFTVFKEFYRRGCSVQEAAAWLHAHCPEKKDSSGYIHVRFPDPSVHNKNQSQPVLHEGQQQDHRASIADEFARYKVILYQGVDNDVITGITRVKEYLRFDPLHPHPYKRGVKGGPRLFIGENCSNTLLEFDAYRWPDKRDGAYDKSEVEKPVKDNDHACFPASCQVYTKSGMKSISLVSKGESIRTLSGWSKVLGSSKTGTRETMVVEYDGGSFEATIDHPVFVIGRGFIELQYLNASDKILICKAFSLMEKGISGMGSIIGVTKGIMELQKPFIRQYGNMLMGTFLRGGISIILMGILGIIISKIYKPCLHRIICMYTNLGKRLCHLQRLGMQQKKEEGGIVNMGKKHGLVRFLKSMYVKCVIGSLRLLNALVSGFVILIAKCASITSLECRTVLSLTKSGTEKDVYNVATEDGTVYVDSVLFRQCDALRYCILNSAKPLSEILSESVERGTVSYLIQSHRQMLEARDQPQVSDY